MNMRKYILPSALVLALAGTFAAAQTINKALQLSQDATGAFGVDTNNGVYFPGHILSPTGGQQPAPTVSSGGTTPTISGTDAAGVITVNAAATTVTATFGRAFVSIPSCLVTPNDIGTAAASKISYTVATTSLAITAVGAAGAANKYYYFCPSAS